MRHQAKLGSVFLATALACGTARPQTNGNSVALAAGMTLNAELTSSLDSKKTKVGDAVNARLAENLKADGVVLIPKGAKLVGHVTQATARAKGEPNSSLAIQFEKVVLKNGQEIPLNVWIRAIAAEPRSAYQPGPEQNTMAGTPGAGQSPMGSGRSMGGPPAATAPPVGAMGGGEGSTNGEERTAGSTGGLNASGQLTPNSRGVFGLDGVQLAADGSNAAQGSLITSSGKTVHLDSGTRLLLVVLTDTAATPSK